jgi:hypothetical protein
MFGKDPSFMANNMPVSFLSKTQCDLSIVSYSDTRILRYSIHGKLGMKGEPKGK